ncbi:MAG TPA: dienelactone hydrolase family protein [Stellaceae bacterium]|nr:dienelactone hydrolase family protein [Stellaceae bacterium]
MASIILFHSVFGLRHVEFAAAERFRAAGHAVVAPDLFDGQSADTIDRGFELMKSIGWSRICARAENAVSDLPADTVLAGISMGAGVVASVWPSRPDTKGILLLHGLAQIPENARKSLPVQVHVAERDQFVSADERRDWQHDAIRHGLSLEIFDYPGAGHFFTDESLQDYNAQAAAKTWAMVATFLEDVS